MPFSINFIFPFISKHFPIAMQISTISSAVLWYQPSLYARYNFKADFSWFLLCRSLILEYFFLILTHYSLYHLFSNVSRNFGNNHAAELFSLISLMMTNAVREPFYLLSFTCIFSSVYISGHVCLYDSCGFSGDACSSWKHSTMSLWLGMGFLEALTLHLSRNTFIPVLQEHKFSCILSSFLQHVPPSTLKILP